MQVVVRIDPLVVVVHGNGQGPLGVFLSDDEFIERFLDFERGEVAAGGVPLGGDGRHVVADDIDRARDAEVADVHIRSGNNAVHFFGRAPAERTGDLLALFRLLTHTIVPISPSWVRLFVS